jgi:hypothetical protein
VRHHHGGDHLGDPGVRLMLGYILGVAVAGMAWHAISQAPREPEKAQARPLILRALGAITLYFAANVLIWLWRHAQ